MVRAVNKLTALGVLREKKPGRYGDGAGLYLIVDSGGSRRWLMIFKQDGRQREMGLQRGRGLAGRCPEEPR